MIELKKLRGKTVLVNGGEIENDIRLLFPILFPFSNVEEIYLEFPNEIRFCFTSPDNVDTDYKSLSAGHVFRIYAVSVTNLKIKSVTTQEGYIFTAGL